MRVLQAVAQQVVSLFVSDWTQTVGIAVILALGFAVSRPLRALPVGFAIAFLLAAHLVLTTVIEARQRSQP